MQSGGLIPAIFSLMELSAYIQKLEAFDFAREVESIVASNSDVLEELQIQQLYSGQDYYGKPITLDGHGYSPATIVQKKNKGQPYNRVTWKDTGDLYSRLVVAVSGKKITYAANTFKFAKMLERSGDDVVGLNIENRSKFMEEVVRPGILAAYRRLVR